MKVLKRWPGQGCTSNPEKYFFGYKNIFSVTNILFGGLSNSPSTEQTEPILIGFSLFGSI
jgi:hypothetical protein